jgi:ubiquinone/menaquinone biosynthesis C-methylase UbiE
MDHLHRTKQEFARQAEGFSASPATTDRQQARRLVEAIGADAKGLVLDVACGPGIVTVELAAIAREVVALDLTPQMLAKARERCEQAGRVNVTFKEGSAAELPFPDNCFDAVVTRLSFHHFEDPRRVLREVTRVVKVGGTVVVADVTSSEDAEKSALQNAIERLRDPSHVRMLSTSELEALLCEPPLGIERVETWDKPREFEEWMGIVASPERAELLRVVARALAKAGADAGMGLAIVDGATVFFHRWHLIVARKR